MGWFEDQIKLRKEKDDEAFREAFAHLAGSVMGRKLSAAFSDDRQKVKDSLDEVMRFYHVKTREVPEEIRDADEQMEYLFRPYGIMRRTVVLEENWRKDAVGVLLGTRRDGGGLVTLLPGKIGGYRFYDLDAGKYRRVNSKNEKLFDREAICFYKPFPLRKLSGKEFYRCLAESLSAADGILFGAATLAVTALGMLVPKLNNVIFSQIIVSGNLQSVMAMAVFMLCAVFSRLLATAVRALFLTRIQTKLSLHTEAAVMMRILSLPADFFKAYGAGELSSRIQNIGTLCQVLTSSVLDLGLSALFSLVYIAQIFTYAPALAAPAFCTILAMALFSAASAWMQAKISGRQMELASKEGGMSYALISGIQKIRLAGAEKRAFARWAKLYAKEAELQYHPPSLLKWNAAISAMISLAGAFALQYTAVKSGVGVAEYYAFYAAYGMVSGAFLSLASAALQAAKAKPAMDMVKPLLEAKPEVSEDRQVVSRLSGGIELNNISFRYNDHMPWVLDNLSLKIRPGQYVAIAGATGCGKSTLMTLMLGFERPQKGAIYYDGRDIETIDLKSLRRRIGVVMQNGKLFQGDIYSNIAISAPKLTIDEAWEAAEMAGMAEDIRNMPMGMHTLIAEGSSGISGGQRQRLMIARAIAAKPRILMLDEATSALDNLTQRTVSDSLGRLKCTRIVIAHRLSTIRQCDRILVLDKGKIIEDGTYDELVGKNGFFADLVRRQRID